MSASAPAQPSFTLLISRPGHAREEVKLSPLPLLVGRVKTNQIVILGDPAISREHCRFEWDPKAGALLVRDLGSSNGTIVNGRSLEKEPAKLRLGDKIQVGAVTMVLAEAVGSAVRTESRQVLPKHAGVPLPPVEGEDERTSFGEDRCTCGRCGAILSTNGLGPGEKVGCIHCRAVWMIPVVRPKA